MSDRVFRAEELNEMADYYDDCSYRHYHPVNAAMLRQAARDRRVVERSEMGWLIETGAQPPTYWGGNAVDDFTDDVNLAVRFARKEDAERIRCVLLGTMNRAGKFCKSVEHLWVTT